VDEVQLELDGRPRRELTDPRQLARTGLVGVDVAATTVDGAPRTVVQLLFDDDQPSFDRALLHAPIVAEVVGPDGEPLAREPFDHDAFRRQLRAEQDAGESTTRGVLLLTGGELPPPWVRLAFLPVPLERTGGARLVLRRTTVEELRAGVEQAHGAGAIDERERQGLLTVIDQLHPTSEP
jgi:hypothetical protein